MKPTTLEDHGKAARMVARMGRMPHALQVAPFLILDAQTCEGRNGPGTAYSGRLYSREHAQVVCSFTQAGDGGATFWHWTGETRDEREATEKRVLQWAARLSLADLGDPAGECTFYTAATWSEVEPQDRLDLWCAVWVDYALPVVAR